MFTIILVESKPAFPWLGFLVDNTGLDEPINRPIAHSDYMFIILFIVENSDDIKVISSTFCNAIYIEHSGTL